MVFPLVAGALFLASAATDQHGPYDVTIHGANRVCNAQWCQPGQDVRDADAYVAEQVATATADRTCWTDSRNRIPNSLVVHAVGTTVVEVVRFDEGFKAASAGKVWVDAKCA